MVCAREGSVTESVAGASSDSPNPFLFVVGCSRSGTTLLRRIIDAHPQIAMTRETHWIPVFFRERRGLTSEGSVTPELISCLLEEPKFATMGLTREQMEPLLGGGEAVRYARFVSGLFDLFGQAQGKRLVGDKCPSYTVEVATLHALWPRTKFVHLIRDGRDVCLSALNWRRADKLAERFRTWSEDPVTTAALWWSWNVSGGREAGSRLGPGCYHEVRYEALVTRPEQEVPGLCAFLGVPCSEAMLRFHEGRTRPEGGRDAKHAWLPVTPGLRDWRTQMPAEDQERFEAAAGPLLSELGYERSVSSSRSDFLQHVARLRALFAEDARALGHPYLEEE
jgi:hypothetical protein